MQLISSIKHPLIIEARGLNKPAARLHSCLIEGAASIVWALDADITVQIPMQDDVESLNVAVATGISVYELKLKVIIAMLTKYIKSIFGRELGVTHQLVQAAFAAELKKITTYSTKKVILLMIMVCDCTMTLSQIEKDTACCGEDLDKLL